MKKFIILASTLAATAGSLQAASLIAGWDLTNLTTPTTGTVDANWSDITNDLTSNGAIYWDGSNGSSTITNGGFGGVTAESFNVSQNQTISTRAFNNQLGTSPALSLGFLNSISVDPSSQSFVIEAGLNDGNGYENVVLTFASALTNAGNAIDITWEYSLDGLSYLTTGVTSSISTAQASGGELETVAVPGAFTDAVYLRGTFGTIDSFAQIDIDNIQVVGDAVVPEPSTYAIIAGVAVLGLAMIRRRKA